MECIGVAALTDVTPNDVIPTPNLPSSTTEATSPASPSLPSPPLPPPQYSRYEPSPLYTEINIPLPPLPNSPTVATPTSPASPEPARRHRKSSSLTSFTSLHRRRPSQPTEAGPKPDPRIELSMSAAAKGRRKRTGTIDAAIIPAVMVLRAELFTPGQGEREKRALDQGDRLEVVKGK